MCGRKLNSELRPQMVVTVVHEWVIKAECDFPLTGIMLAGPRSVASTAAETIKAYTVNLLCCPPLSLCALLSHHIYVYFFRFHLLLDLLQWAVRWDALWRKKAGRFQRELHAAEGEQRLHTRLQLLMI